MQPALREPHALFITRRGRQHFGGSVDHGLCCAPGITLGNNGITAKPGNLVAGCVDGSLICFLLCPVERGWCWEFWLTGHPDYSQIEGWGELLLSIRNKKFRDVLT